jgi:hypothetical protein
MNPLKILLIGALILLAGALIFLSANLATSGENETPELKSYTYTKAICDKDNFCQDNIITCKGNQVVSMDAITGASIQLPKTWQDPRSEREINEFCLN